MAGLSPHKLEERLVKFYNEGKFVRNPQVSVFGKEYRHQRITVTGVVAHPGSYQVIGPCTLLEIAAKTRGLNKKVVETVSTMHYHDSSGLTKTKKGPPGIVFTWD